MKFLGNENRILKGLSRHVLGRDINALPCRSLCGLRFSSNCALPCCHCDASIASKDKEYHFCFWGADCDTAHRNTAGGHTRRTRARIRRPQHGPDDRGIHEDPTHPPGRTHATDPGAPRQRWRETDSGGAVGNPTDCQSWLKTRKRVPTTTHPAQIGLRSPSTTSPLLALLRRVAAANRLI